MSTKTRKRKVNPKEVDGTLPSVNKRPKGAQNKGRLCSVSGCTKQIQQGGVCCRHGAKTTRAKCSHEDYEEGPCQNVAKRGGLCRVSVMRRPPHLMHLFLTFRYHNRSTEHSSSKPAPALDARGSSSSKDKTSVMFTLRAARRKYASSAL